MRPHRELKQLLVKPIKRINNGLTYALGAKCSDGIVIIADKRITETTGEIRYENKTYQRLHQAVWVSSGDSRADFELFLGRFEEEISKQPNHSFKSYEILPNISSLIKKCYDEKRSFETLFGIRIYPHKKTHLFHFDETGAQREIIDYYAIGKEDLGRFFLKAMYNNSLTMRQVAVLGTIIIHSIEKLKLDDSIGIGDYFPTIWWVPNLIEPYKDDTELPEELKSQYSVREEKDQNILRDIQQSAEEILENVLHCLQTPNVIKEN